MLRTSTRSWLVCARNKRLLCSLDHKSALCERSANTLLVHVIFLYEAVYRLHTGGHGWHTVTHSDKKKMTNVGEKVCHIACGHVAKRDNVCMSSSHLFTHVVNNGENRQPFSIGCLSKEKRHEHLRTYVRFCVSLYSTPVRSGSTSLKSPSIDRLL